MAAGDVDKPIKPTAALQPNLPTRADASSSRSHTTSRHRMQTAGAVRHAVTGNTAIPRAASRHDDGSGPTADADPLTPLGGQAHTAGGLDAVASGAALTAVAKQPTATMSPAVKPNQPDRCRAKTPRSGQSAYDHPCTHSVGQPLRVGREYVDRPTGHGRREWRREG